MLEFTPPTYSERVQELVNAINVALFEMNTLDWPTIMYKIEGTGSRAVRLAIVHVTIRNDGDGPYYAGILTNRARTMRSNNFVTLTQHDLDFIAKQVGLTPTDYEAI